MEPVTVQLRARNDDKQLINFDVRYDNKEHLQVDCAPTVLQPGETKAILVTFRPRLVQPYAEVVPLHINGLYTINVNFKGKRGCGPSLVSAPQSAGAIDSVIMLPCWHVH
jgi:hypothetical protein